LACGAAGVARPIRCMRLTCMMVAADLDWCGAGGATRHARVYISYIERYIYTRRPVEYLRLLLSCIAGLLIVKD
jgi:hypothetical protein